MEIHVFTMLIFHCSKLIKEKCDSGLWQFRVCHFRAGAVAADLQSGILVLGLELRSLGLEIYTYTICMLQCKQMINEQCKASVCTTSPLPFAIHIRIEECIKSIASFVGACVAGDWYAQLWKFSGKKQQTVLPQGSGYIGCSGKKVAGVANGC